MAKSLLLSDEKYCLGFFTGALLSLGFVIFTAKILLPILVASSEGSIWLTYVTWDFWWLVYFYVGWKIQYPAPKIWRFAISAALLDFLLSAYRLFQAAFAPVWDAWKGIAFFCNLLSFLVALLLFLYLFSHSTRREFGVERPAA